MVIQQLHEWDNGTFPAHAFFHRPAFHLASFRVLKSELVQAPIGPVIVAFPPSLCNGTLADLKGHMVDVRLKLVAATGAMATDAVAVTLAAPATALEIPVRDLWDPITITFPRPRALRLPVDEWYQCAYDAGGVWDPEGVWLTADSDAVRCHTAHLSTFAVLPVIRVLGVQVQQPCLAFRHCLWTPLVVLMGFGWPNGCIRWVGV